MTADEHRAWLAWRAQQAAIAARPDWGGGARPMPAESPSTTEAMNQAARVAFGILRDRRGSS